MIANVLCFRAAEDVGPYRCVRNLRLVPLSQHTDKSKFEDGRIWNPPLRNNGNFIDSAFFPPKEKWALKKKRLPQTVFALGKYWARPLRHGTRHVRTHPMGYPKNLSKKGFCGAFSLKKRPPAPAGAPPINQKLHTQLKQSFRKGKRS